MSFVSLKFIMFFTLVLLIKYLLQKKASDKVNIVFLLIINYIFYLSFNVKYVFLLLATTIIVYYCALKCEKNIVYYFGIMLPLLVLVYFKYSGLFIELLTNKVTNMVLPIGISFYIFELISYLIDVRKKRINVEKDLILFATYVSFFPNIASGPIVRAKSLIKQLKEKRLITRNNIETGVQIIALGYFKKMVIADRLAIFTDEVFFAPKAFNWLTILLAVFSYSIQIYMDFSGYSDIAIGCAKCLGYDFELNFNMPYISGSVTEFWRRWHISLSTWFKDYVYIPLGGNKKGIYKQLINLLIVMTLSGIWHGAGLNYFLWGVTNGLLLCIEKLLHNQKSKNIFKIIINYILISFTWLLFRITNIKDLMDIINGVLLFKGGVSHMYIWSFVSLLFMVIYVLLMINTGKKHKYLDYYYINDLTTIKGLTVFFTFIGLIICLAYANTNPFVYFQF